jgi:hypothetical protein
MPNQSGQVRASRVDVYRRHCGTFGLLRVDHAVGGILDSAQRSHIGVLRSTTGWRMLEL